MSAEPALAAGGPVVEKPAKHLDRRTLQLVRSRAWALAMRDYDALVADIKRDLASGAIQLDQIETWERR